MSVKLPDFLSWQSLNILRQKMDAILTNNFVLTPTYSENSIFEKKLREGGVEIDIEEITVHDDGTLICRDYRVLLHIRDVITINGNTNLPRYHLAFCSTLEQMQKQSRFARYVVAQTTSGEFTINIINNKNITSHSEKLKVCQNCLSKIEWKGFNRNISYTEKKNRVEDFSLSDFFDEYPRDLIQKKPSYTSITAPINNYPDNWEDLSKKIRKQRGNKCEVCGIHLSGSKAKYLHVHHRNGIKNDNINSNLEVTCIRCHANKPKHQHIKNSPDYKDFISQYNS